MNQNQANILIFAVAVLIVIGAACLFTVHETRQAIVLRFGEPVKVHSDAGLKVKLPWPIETVEYFDARVLNVDPRAERVNLSSDDRNPIADLVKDIDGEENDEDAKKKTKSNNRVGSIPIIVDTFARWKIVDPLLFLQRLRSEANAETRIENVMNAATRDILGKTTLSRLLSSERVELMGQIRDRVNSEMKARGVEIVDIRIGRADLTEQLRDSTVNRMITERREEATEARAKGNEKALRIKSTAEKERTILIAEAAAKAEQLRGEGDRTAIELITAAANEDRDFYAFLNTMYAYRTTLASPDTTLVLSPDSSFLRYLKSQDND